MSPSKSEGSYRLQLCVFDSKRDYPEGQEAKRILAYYPEACSVDDQTAVVGLAEALVTFATNFDQVIDRHWLASSVRERDLQGILQNAYQAFTLILGPLRTLLESDPGAAKSGLQSTLNETASRLQRPRSSDLTALQNPLNLLHGVPWMPLEGQSFTATHSLASQLMQTSLGSSQTVHGMMLLHDRYCLWSSLAQQNTTALYQLASTAMLAVAKQPSMAKRLAKASGSARSRTAEQPQQPTQSSKAWLRHQNGFLGLKSPQSEDDSDLAVPTVHLQGEEEPAGLLGYCQGNMLLLVLLSRPGIVSMQVQQSVLQVVQTPLRRIDSHVKEQLSSNGSFHVPGFRYLYIDHMLAAVQASPLSKVSTLSHDSLALMASARDELHSMDPQQADREVVARGAHDCWVVAKHRNGRELYLVLEGRGEIGLSGASKLAAQFCGEHMASLGL